MSQEVRFDAAHTLAYPPKADAKGTARIYYQRKPFYLGKYDSPVSYVMFALWKQHLEKTGNALPGSEFKTVAEEMLKVSPPKAKRLNLQICVAAACCLLACASTFAIGRISSTPPPVKVDSLALSTDERVIIESIRNQRREFAEELAESSGTRVANNFLALTEEGHSLEPRHTLGMGR